jgi:hypothetical protein
MYYKNLVNNQIGFFGGIPDKNWVLATQNEIDIYKLEQTKSFKLTQITSARNIFMYANIEYKNLIFVNNQISGNNLTSEIATETLFIEWLDLDGKQVNLTLKEAKELLELIKFKRRSGYFQEADLIKKINACTTLEEIESININFE